MKSRLHLCVVVIVLAALSAAKLSLLGDEKPPQEQPKVPSASDAVSKGSPMPDALGLVELVLSKHVDPPTRQEMILGGARSLLKAAKLVQPSGLSRRVSGLGNAEQIQSFLNTLWDEAKRSQISADQLEFAFYQGILSAIPGDAYRIGTKELKINEQLAGNRYIGIGIVLRYIDGYAQVTESFKGGPAAKAGMKADDLIVAVDGSDMHDVPLQKVVEKLRGVEGSVVEVTVRKPQATEERALKMTRSVVPRETVVGLEPTADDTWKLRASSSAPIGYLRIKEIGSSTVHELRQFEQQLNQQGIKALILDLRRTAGSLHHAVILADALLDGGKIGQVRTPDGLQSYEAEPDCLFRGWPLAVLADRATSGETEWLIAALQDQGRAVIVGEPTWGRAFTVTSVPLPNGEAAIMLATGLLERGDGRSLHAPRQGPPPAPFEIADRKARESRGGVYPDYFVGAEEIKLSPVAAPAKFTEKKAGYEKLETRERLDHAAAVVEKPKDAILLKAIAVLETKVVASK